MQRHCLALLVLTCVALNAAPVNAQERPFTFEEAIRMARANAPAIAVARARVDETRSELVGASARFRENPSVEGAIGHRSAETRDYRDVDLQLSQPFELGGRRSLRINRAEASISREIATSAEVERLVVGDAARAFLRALGAEERVRIAGRSREIVQQLLDATERRHRAGDVPDLDLNAARIAQARAESDVLAAEASREMALGELRGVLGFPQTERIDVSGDLRAHRPAALATLLARAAERPELRVLAAEREIAEADRRLGTSYRLPDIGARLGAQKDGGDNVVLAGIGVSLPIFQRGQELQALGIAGARRAELELTAARARIETEVSAAFETWRRASAALEVLEQKALPAMADNEALSLRSYEAGAINLPELLVLRRDILDAREAYIQRLIDAAEAAVDVEVRAGALR